MVYCEIISAVCRITKLKPLTNANLAGKCFLQMVSLFPQPLNDITKQYSTVQCSTVKLDHDKEQEHVQVLNTNRVSQEAAVEVAVLENR